MRLALVAAFAAASLLAQEHPPVAPTAAPEAPTAADAGKKPQGPRKGKEPFELPEFTPVAAPKVEGLAGKQYFWFCLYPDFVVQYDPATDKVVNRVKLANGMFWNTTLTQDRKRLLVVTDQQRTIEVVDLQQHAVVGTHSFTEDGFILRIRDVREMPGGICWLVRLDRVKTEIDRYSFEPAQWLLYDSAAKKTLRKLDKLPETMDRGARLSADGTQWLANDENGNLLFLGGRKLEELGRIDLATPRFFGAGGIRLSGTDLLDGRDPKRALMVFTSTDPVESARTSWGLVDLDLEHRRVAAVTEWGPNVQSWGMRVAPSKKVGALMTGNFGRNDEDTRTHLMLYDLENGKLLAETYEEFRPRRMLVAISPAADKVYVGVAGSDFEVFDQKLQRIGSVELDGEISGRIYVVDG